MAEEIGIPPATLWKVEKGKVVPQDFTVARIRNRFPEIFEPENAVQEEIAS